METFNEVMELDTTQLEEELKALKPVALSDGLLDRFDLAMLEQTGEREEEKIIVASCDPQLAALEESLKDLVPYGIPEDMISRLDEAMSRWHEEVPVEEKVVPMHIEIEPARRESSWLGLRSVAAVGLLGAGLAFMMSEPQASSVAETQKIPVTNVVDSRQVTPVVFTSNNARSSVVSANDHGVVWTRTGSPVRCTEVHVRNRVFFVNEKGQKIILELPKREMRFTPVKFD